MKPTTRKHTTLDTIAAVALVVLFLAAMVWLWTFIEGWRAEVWAERFHQMRPTTGEPR
jgi:hypothetical protein